MFGLCTDFVTLPKRYETFTATTLLMMLASVSVCEPRAKAPLCDLTSLKTLICMPFTGRWSTAIVALVVIGTVLTAGCTSNVETTQTRSVTVGVLLPHCAN
ncbi:MAG: hypothetical protein ACXVI0_10905 [Halobacteriota archaeon]